MAHKLPSPRRSIADLRDEQTECQRDRSRGHQVSFKILSLLREALMGLKMKSVSFHWRISAIEATIHNKITLKDPKKSNKSDKN